MMTPPQTGPAAAGIDRVFAALNRSPVHRSAGHVVAGVCGGLAPSSASRPRSCAFLTVLAALLGPAIVLYLVAWLLLPDVQGRTHLERAIRDGKTSSIILLVVAVLAVLPDGGVHPRVGSLLLLLILGGVGWML